jgi:hypothetical protein
LISRNLFIIAIFLALGIFWFFPIIVNSFSSIYPFFSSFPFLQNLISNLKYEPPYWMGQVRCETNLTEFLDLHNILSQARSVVLIMLRLWVRLNISITSLFDKTKRLKIKIIKCYLYTYSHIELNIRNYLDKVFSMSVNII